MSSIDHLTSLPAELLSFISHKLELPDQAALSKTCRTLFGIVKSNNAALNELKYLTQNYMPCSFLDHHISPKLYEAVQKQELRSKAQMTGEDNPIAQIFLKKIFCETLEKAQNIWRNLPEELQKQLTPDGRNIFSAKTYENNIEQEKLITICSYIDLHNMAFALKDRYKEMFSRDLKVLDVKNNPSVLKNLDIFLQTSNELYNQIAVYLLFYSISELFPEALEYFMSIKDKSDKEIISLFEEWAKSSTTNIVNRIGSLKNQNILHILTSFTTDFQNRELFDIWKTYFFEPIFNVIPKERIFQYLIEVDENGNTPIFYASIKLSNESQNWMFQNTNSKFVNYLLESVDPDKRAACLLVKVNDRETVFQKILQNTEDENLIKTILETVFPNPADLRKFLKENFKSFAFASEKPSKLKLWIGSKLIEENLSNFEFDTLYSILSFNLRFNNIKNVAKALKSIKDVDLRKELIYRLFENNSIDKDSKEFLYIFEIIYLLPDITSQVEFIKLIDYKILKINYRSDEYDSEFLEVSVEELYGYLCENLETEVVVENFDFEMHKYVVNSLFSQLNKEEKLKALKNHVLSKLPGNDVNFYKFLESHDILYEALTELTIKFNSHKNCSLIQFLIHDSYFHDEKKKCLSYIFEVLKTRTITEILDLLMKGAQVPGLTTKYKKLRQKYFTDPIEEIVDSCFPDVLDQISEYINELDYLLDKDRKEALNYLVEEDQKHYHQLINDFPNFKFHLENIFPNITKEIEDLVKKTRIKANETIHEEDPRARKKTRVERGSKRKRK